MIYSEANISEEGVLKCFIQKSKILILNSNVQDANPTKIDLLSTVFEKKLMIRRFNYEEQVTINILN